MSRLPVIVTVMVAITLSAWKSPCVSAEDKSASAEREQLAAVLTSDSPYAEKLSACKRLARIGTGILFPLLPTCSRMKSSRTPPGSGWKRFPTRPPATRCGVG